MITHIVLINLKAGVPNDVKMGIVDKLRQLRDEISLIRRWEVGTNIGASSSPGDIVVNSTFDSLDDVQSFRVHPAHEAFKNFLKPYLEVSYTVDYESESQEPQ